MTNRINVAIIGLGFGAEFIPIYQNHPHTNMYAICQRTKDRLNEVGDAFSIEKRYTDYTELLEDPTVDAVHINSPIHEHAKMSIAVDGGQTCGLYGPRQRQASKNWNKSFHRRAESARSI